MLSPVSSASQAIAKFRNSPDDKETSRIFIVAEQDFSIDGVVSIITKSDRQQLVCCVSPGESCRQKFVEMRPEVLMLHEGILPKNYREFLHGIFADHPDVRIIVFGRDIADNHLMELIRCGVHGYINQRMTGEHLNEAIEQVKNGGLWIERHIMQRFIQTTTNINTSNEANCVQLIAKLCENLTKREMEILREVMAGHPTKVIASHVNLSDQGVKVHLGNLFKKFKVCNRPQLILAVYNAISPNIDMAELVQHNMN